MVGGRGPRIQLLKRTTQGPSLPSLVQIGPVVSDKKIKMQKGKDNGRFMVAIAHMTLWGLNWSIWKK